MTEPDITLRDSDPQRSAPAVQRGAEHPSASLKEAVQLLALLKAAVGFGATSRESAVEAWDHTALSGEARRKLAMLSHFGLIDKVGKGAIQISALGKAILVPTSPTELREAYVTAVKNPRLYANLIEKYAGHALPSLLPNLLIREHAISATSASEAAQIFRESVDWAGLLRSGILYADTLNDSGAEAPPVIEAASTPSPQASAPGTSAVASIVSPPGGAAQSFPIALGSNRFAHLSIPVPIQSRDLKRISAWVAYMTANALDEEE